MDVMGGRTLALYDMAHLLANDPAYLGQPPRKCSAHQGLPPPLSRRRATSPTTALQAACGKSMEECAREDTGRFNSPAANEAFYASTQTYDLPVVSTSNTRKAEDVGKLASRGRISFEARLPVVDVGTGRPDPGRRPKVSGGGFLDNGTPFGVYSRLNLFAAAGRAAILVSTHLSAARVRQRSRRKKAIQRTTSPRELVTGCRRKPQTPWASRLARVPGPADRTNRFQSPGRRRGRAYRAGGQDGRVQSRANDPMVKYPGGRSVNASRLLGTYHWGVTIRSASRFPQVYPLKTDRANAVYSCFRTSAHCSALCVDIAVGQTMAR